MKLCEIRIIKMLPPCFVYISEIERVMYGDSGGNITCNFRLITL